MALRGGFGRDRWECEQHAGERDPVTHDLEQGGASGPDKG